MITSTGQDVYINNEKFEIGRNFMTKIWNAAKFMEMHSEGFDANTSIDSDNILSPDDQFIFSKLNQLIFDVKNHIEKYRFNDATLSLYDFFWHSYCDRYLEYAKPILYKGSQEEKDHILSIMHKVFQSALQLLHPFMPFLTEELWEGMHYNYLYKRIIIAPWPELLTGIEIDDKIVAYVEGKYDLIRVGRILRADYNLNNKQTANFYLVAKNAEIEKQVNQDKDLSLIHI